MEKDMEYYSKKYNNTPVENAINTLTYKWTLYILKDLYCGKKYFKEFQEKRPQLDNKSLSRCLKNMEKNNLIEKIGNKYYLTEKGKHVNRIFFELVVFALETDEENNYTENEKENIIEYYKKMLKI